MCVANAFWPMTFLISMGSLLKSFAASYLKVLDTIEDSISGAPLDFKLLGFFNKSRLLALIVINW